MFQYLDTERYNLRPTKHTIKQKHSKVAKNIQQMIF